MARLGGGSITPNRCTPPADMTFIPLLSLSRLNKYFVASGDANKEVGNEDANSDDFLITESGDTEVVSKSTKVPVILHQRGFLTMTIGAHRFHMRLWSIRLGRVHMQSPRVHSIKSPRPKRACRRQAVLPPF